MDDAGLAIFVNKSALAMLAIPHVEKRRDFLARLHDGLIAEMRAKRLDRDLARVRADMVVEEVLDAMAYGVPRLRTAIEKLERNAEIDQVDHVVSAGKSG